MRRCAVFAAFALILPLTLGNLCFAQHVTEVRSGQWKAIRLAPDAILETKSLMTCVGVAGYNSETHTAFLAHFLFYDSDPNKSFVEFDRHFAQLRKFLKKTVGNIEGFEILIAGGNDRSEAFFGHVHREVGAHMPGNNFKEIFGGEYILDISIRQRSGIQVEFIHSPVSF